MTNVAMAHSASAGKSLRHELLGVCQIVLGVNRLDESERQLCEIGYRIKGRCLDVSNPPQKKHFVGPTMVDTHDLSMLVPKGRSVPLELVQADGGGDRSMPPAFEAISVPATATDAMILATIQATLAGEEVSNPMLGFRNPSPEPDSEVRAILIRTIDIDASLTFVGQLGLTHQWIGPRMARVDVRGVTLGVKLSLYFATATRVANARPDQSGMICITFLCKDVARLTTQLRDLGHDVGEPFEMNPFGTPIRALFVRAVSGEMYEFLSVLKSSGTREEGIEE